MVQQKHAHGRRRRARRTAATLAAVSFAAGCGAGDADEASVATSAPPSTMMGAATAPATSVEPSTTPPTSGPTTTAAAMTTVAAIDFTADAGGFIDLATTTERIAAGGGAVWTGNERSGLTKIDPVSMTATRHDGIALGEHFAYGFDSVWVASFDANLVYRVDPSTLEVVAEIPVPYNPKGMGVADDGIWVAQHRGGSASLIDPTTNEIDAVVPISRTGAHGPEFPVVLDGDVWVGALNAGVQARIDRATRNVTLIETPPHGPSGKAIGTTPAGVIVLDGGGARVRSTPSSTQPRTRPGFRVRPERSGPASSSTGSSGWPSNPRRPPPAACSSPLIRPQAPTAGRCRCARPAPAAPSSPRVRCGSPVTTRPACSGSRSPHSLASSTMRDSAREPPPEMDTEVPGRNPRAPVRAPAVSGAHGSSKVADRGSAGASADRAGERSRLGRWHRR